MAIKKTEKQPPPTIVSLDRDRLVFCDHRTGETVEFMFPSESIRDLEIIDKIKLHSALQEFIKQKQFPPSQVVLVLSSNIYFDKNLSNLSEEDRKVEAQEFVESIPFASIGSRMFTIGQEHKIVAINRDLYEVVRTAFEGLGFKVVAASPAFVLFPLGAPEQFNYESCRVIFRKLDYMKANSFLTDNSDMGDYRQKQRHFLLKHKGIFSVLSLLAVVMALGTSVYTLRKPVRPSASAKIVPTGAVRRNPTVTATMPTPSQISDRGQIRVAILNGSTQTGQADQIKIQLSRLGFTNITTGNATAAADKTLLLISSKVHPSVSDQVLTVLRSLFTEVDSQQVDQPDREITIISGR